MNEAGRAADAASDHPKKLVECHEIRPAEIVRAPDRRFRFEAGCNCRRHVVGVKRRRYPRAVTEDRDDRRALDDSEQRAEDALQIVAVNNAEEQRRDVESGVAEPPVGIGLRATVEASTRDSR